MKAFPEGSPLPTPPEGMVFAIHFQWCLPFMGKIKGLRIKASHFQLLLVLITSSWHISLRNNVNRIFFLHFTFNWPCVYSGPLLSAKEPENIDLVKCMTILANKALKLGFGTQAKYKQCLMMMYCICIILLLIVWGASCLLWKLLISS